MTADERTAPGRGAGGGADGTGVGRSIEFTSAGPVLKRCAPGLGLSVESGLLAEAEAAGRPLDAVMVERIVFGTCAPDRRLGELDG